MTGGGGTLLLPPPPQADSNRHIPIAIQAVTFQPAIRIFASLLLSIYTPVQFRTQQYLKPKLPILRPAFQKGCINLSLYLLH